MSQPIRGQGRHLVFPRNLTESKNSTSSSEFVFFGPKNPNSVEDVEFLLPVKFH